MGFRETLTQLVDGHRSGEGVASSDSFRHVLESLGELHEHELGEAVERAVAPLHKEIGRLFLELQEMQANQQALQAQLVGTVAFATRAGKDGRFHSAPAPIDLPDESAVESELAPQFCSCEPVESDLLDDGTRQDNGAGVLVCLRLWEEEAEEEVRLRGGRPPQYPPPTGRGEAFACWDCGECKCCALLCRRPGVVAGPGDASEEADGVTSGAAPGAVRIGRPEEEPVGPPVTPHALGSDAVGSAVGTSATSAGTSSGVSATSANSTAGSCMPHELKMCL